ncbi:hypothetical protein C2E23DRAFT_823329 [Lenzites betulinus]|nr:hypothetical protein C2E23DRAFT_823329 [Lenzites betulinus]
MPHTETRSCPNAGAPRQPPVLSMAKKCPSQSCTDRTQHPLSPSTSPQGCRRRTPPLQVAPRSCLTRPSHRRTPCVGANACNYSWSTRSPTPHPRSTSPRAKTTPPSPSLSKEQ